MSATSGYSLLNLFLWQTLCSRCLPFGCFGEINYVGTQHVTTTKKRALLCARSAAQGYNADSKTMEHNKKGFNCTQMKTAERQHFHFTDCSNCRMCLFLIWSMFKQVGKEKTKKGWKSTKSTNTAYLITIHIFKQVQMIVSWLGSKFASFKGPVSLKPEWGLLTVIKDITTWPQEHFIQLLYADTRAYICKWAHSF